MEENETLTPEQPQAPDVAAVIGAPETFGAFRQAQTSPEFSAVATPRDTQRAALKQALGTEMGGPLADIYQREAAATERVARGQLDQRIAEARGLAGAQADYVRGLRGAYAAAESKLMAPPPTFNVTKDTEEGLMGLATIMPLAGLIIGGKGQMAGISAMNAMAGALQGYQTGNKERIAFETKKYEEAWKMWQAQINQVKDSLARYEKLAAADLGSATAQAKADALAKGHGIISDLIDQQGLSKTREIVEKIAVSTAQANSRLAIGPVRGVDVLDKEGNRLCVTEQEFRADFARPETERQYRMAPTQAREPAPIKAVVDGKTVYVDRSGQPILDKEGKPIVAPDTRTAATEIRYSFNVAESMGQAINDLKNVQLLPRDSVLGTFAGLTGADAAGLLDGLRNAFARRVTAEDNRLFEQMIGGLEANMARALGGGYASSTSAKNIEAYRAQVAREGDSPVAKAIFLARMRQELDTLADFFEARPGATPFVPVVKKYQQLLHDAVPFTVEDVIRARSNVQNLPIGSEGARQRTGATGAPAGEAATLPEQARARLKEGEVTTFGNGQRWTLQNGVPVKLQ